MDAMKRGILQGGAWACVAIGVAARHV